MMNAETMLSNQAIAGQAGKFRADFLKSLFVFIAFSLLISLTGLLIFQHYRSAIKSEKQGELAGIADLKIRQIGNWMSDRRSDARTLKNDPLFISAVANWLHDGSPKGKLRDQLLARLSLLQQDYAAYGYTSISLFDTQARLRLSSSADELPIQGIEKIRLLESMQNGEIVFSEIHRENFGAVERNEIELRVPLSQSQNGKSHIMGALLFRISPERFLFPLIQHWPTDSPSAETLLVRKVDNDVLFLNELRHRNNAALSLRMPLTRSDLPATMAVQGQQGVVEGIDYRGMPVIAVLNKLPGTSWSMVSKVDKAEIYESINHLALWLTASLLTIIACGAIVIIYWRKIELGQYASELERRTLFARLDYLTKYANDIILLSDASGKILDFNDRALDAYGYSAADLMKLNISDLRADDTNKTFAERIAEIKQAGSLRFESTHIRSNGEHFPVEASVRVVDVAGQVLLQSIIRDITQRKQSEARENRLRHILNKTRDMIYIFQPDTLRFVYVNQGVIDSMGYTSNELLQLTPLAITPNLTETEFRANVIPLINGETDSLRLETRIRRKDGSNIPVEVLLQLVQDEAGKNVFVAIVRDISERIQAEIRLSRQKKFMWQVIDSDPSQIFVKNEAGQYVLVNRSTAHAHGLLPQQMIGKTLGEINHTSTQIAHYLETNRKVIESGSEISEVIPYTHPDGKQSWLLTIKKRLSMPDGGYGLLGIAVDITQQKRFEVQLSESYKKLQKLTLHLENIRSEERNKIALNLHDEMGATLAALKMKVSWLSSKLPAGLPLLTAEAAQINELISGGIHTMHHIVNQLRPDLLGDVGLVEAIRIHVKKFLAHSNIEYKLVLPDDELLLNAEQSNMIFRIVQESLNNVIKHAQASKLEIRFSLSHKMLLIKIKDNGIGMDMSLNPGHTLGLLSIRERALMIGGKAKISSLPGKGVRVSVSIPYYPPLAEELASDNAALTGS